MPKINTDNYDTVASWNGSQDLFVVEQPDGTKVATPAMVKQYVLGNSINDIYSVMGQNGAKNLIPYPYYRASGYSANGMTTTYDSDGVMTINKVAGSSTAYFSFINNDQDYCFKPNTEYKLLFELENANQLTIYLKYGDADIVLINKKSTGKYVVNFTTPQTLQGRENLAISAAASDTETNAKVKAMIMLASDINDDTYVPYAMTNKQLTETIGDISQTGLTGDSVAEQLATARESIAELTANILAGVSIAAYNSAANQFTAPTDGYVRMELRNANQYFYLNVNNAVLLGGEGHQVTNANDYMTIFIKKGMRLYYTGTVQTAIFYSLVSE